jgi:hypothetical protein
MMSNQQIRGPLIERDRRSSIVWVLAREPLLELPRLPKGRRNWASFSDEELVSHALKFIEENGIRNRKVLDKADSGLYFILRKRKLVDRVGLENSNVGYRKWASMSDDELVDFAKKIVEAKEILLRSELHKADSGLYTVLLKRKLLDEVDIENSNFQHRKWALMSDEELVDFARKIIEGKGITWRTELAKGDQGLYKALSKRKLLERVGLEDKRGDDRKPSGFYTKMSDEELVVFVRKNIGEMGITRRSELEKADKGLYTTLVMRKLIDAVFAPIEQKKKDELFGQLGEAVDAYTSDPK